MLVNLQLPTKGLHLAHINVCSLPNKVHELSSLLNHNNVHILAVTETHLDSSINNGQIHIEGYHLLRRDRNRNGGGVAFYIQNHIHFLRREDLHVNQVEVLWVQLQLPHQSPILVGCVYRPPSSNAAYLNDLCESIDRATDENRDVFLLGDFNINWKDETNANKIKLSRFAMSCNMTQMVNEVTRLSSRKGRCVETCIDLIFCNIPKESSKANSFPVGWSDHNITTITKPTKVPRKPPRHNKKEFQTL